MALLSVVLPLLSCTTARAQCIGDCNGDGDVTVDEVLRIIDRALNPDSDACPIADANRDGTIDIEEVVTAMRVALSECAAGELSLYGLYCSEAGIRCVPPAQLFFCGTGVATGLCLDFDGAWCGGVTGAACPPGLLCFAPAECCDAAGPCVTPQHADVICASALASDYPCFE